MPDQNPSQRTCAIIGLSDITSSASEASLAYGRNPLPYSHAAAIARIPHLRVTAICDLNPAAIDAFQERWGETWPGMATYADAFEMIGREAPDVLVVTPDHLHVDIVVAAAERGIPAIMCEKPLATSLADADRMIAACDKHGTGSRSTTRAGGIPSTTKRSSSSTTAASATSSPSPALSTALARCSTATVPTSST